MSKGDEEIMPTDRTPPSILILSRNEEVNIEACLRCLSFSDDIVVLDSCSTDRTVEFASKFPNVRVIQREFDTEYKQRNYGLHDIEYKHEWLYICDADERVAQELIDEITDVINNPKTTHAAFRLRYKNMYMGKWIKHATSYPVWLIRLVRPKLTTYEMRQTNVHPIVDGTVGELHGHFIHYSFNSGLRRWFEKHNYYSDQESLEGVEVRGGSKPTWKEMRDPDPMKRRRAVKNYSFFLKGRAFWRFMYGYIFRGGILDGIAGFHYCAMISMYEYWIELKVKEHLSQWRSSTNALAEKMEADGAGDEQPQWARAEDGTPLIEVFIPTLNEAAHIEQAVASGLQVGPVFVLDSLSTDGTQELARKAGATVIEHAWEGYSRQKNWGLDNLPFQGKWVFILDADERITPPLRDEVKRVAESQGEQVGFFVNRVVIFMGRAIRHGGLYPSWNLRFFRRGLCRYEDRAVHEHMICDGPTSYLKHEMLHIRRESISQYIDKHIDYADLESDEWVKQRLGQGGGAKAGSMFRDILRYRQWLRRKMWPRMPFRPMLRFVYMYFFRLGVLDRNPGFHLSLLMASYEYMISLLYRDKMLKIHEAKKQQH